jgi:protein O-GlcNAc transferase
MPGEDRRGTQQLLAVALAHHQAGRLDDAERLYGRILDTDARHADALHFLGILQHERGNGERALTLIRRAIAQRSDVPAFHNNLGLVLSAQKRLEEAAASYARAAQLRPGYAEAHFNLGVTLQSLGKREAAAAAYQRAIALTPDYVEAYNNLGVLYIDEGRPGLAIECLGAALSHKPDHAEAHNNLGNALRAVGRAGEAIESYRKALLHDPTHPTGELNIGRLMLEQGKPAEAAQHFERALLLNRSVRALSSLGSALREQGRLSESLAAYRAALASYPDDAEARLGEVIANIPIFADDVAQSREAVGRFIHSLQCLAEWGAQHTDELAQSVSGYVPFYLAYRPQDLRSALCSYGDIVCSATAAHWHPGPLQHPSAPPRAGSRVTTSRTRMLIVSAHVRQHPVWNVILRGLIEQIDRRKFELVLYHTGATCDSQTGWAQDQVDRFVQGPKAARGWLDEIRKDDPDVILYPEVGMDPATCLLASLRLAPLQIAMWGHPVTTGLPSIDAFFSGDLLEGPDADQHYRERLVRLPGTGVYTAVDQPQQTHVWSGVNSSSSSTVRFTLCQQPIKFDPQDDALLVEIARRVDSCEIWLVRPQKLDWTAIRLRDRLARAFLAHGLDPDRYLRLTPWLSSAEFPGFLDAMDVSLDSPAFSGYTTAWQAVHRGLPMVTLAGTYLRQRLAAGVLQQIGMEDQIARSREDYVEIAVRLANERSSSPERAAERRAAIRTTSSRADHNLAAVSAFEDAVSELRGC